MNTVNWQFTKETSMSKVDTFFKEKKMDVSNEIKHYLFKNNNGRPDKMAFDTQETKERTIKKLLSFNMEDNENIYDYKDVVLENRNLIPFAVDNFGNLICFEGVKIVLWIHDEERIEWVSDDFFGFIEKLYL